MANHRKTVLVIALLLAGGLVGCTGPSKPSVEILSPPSGSQVTLGEQVQVEYAASDAVAVVRVELEVDGQVVDSQNSPAAEGQRSMRGILRWTPTEAGTHLLAVHAYNRELVASDPVGVNITVGQGVGAQPTVEGPTPEARATISLILPGETPAATATLTPDEIMTRSAEMMGTVTSAHIVFDQEVVGEFTRTGDGDVMVPGRAHFERTSDGEGPVEMIVIGSYGYWRDDAAASGWNGGPVRCFTSNPASWVPLSLYYAAPSMLADEIINGIDCYHMQFTVNLEPGALGLDSGSSTGEAWIAKSDYSVVKAIYDLQYQSFRDSGSMTLTVDLSEFNKPVIITVPGEQAELDAQTALTILPSAGELGMDTLEFLEFTVPDEGSGFGDLPAFRVSSQDKVVDLIAFASTDDARRFTNQLFSDYDGMGDTPAWTDLGDQSFSRQGEVLVRVDRYILWALGEVTLDQLRPSVERLQTFAGVGS